ncbi:hypothetical protein WAI453_003124 [Rhynchosporium graminicola]
MSYQNDEAVPLVYLSIETLVDIFDNPNLTFGIEMELDFSIARHLHFDWLATNPDIPPFSQPTNLDDLPSRRTEHRTSNRELFESGVTRGNFPKESALVPLRKDSFSTNSIQSANLRQNLMFYFLAFLNRELPSSDRRKGNLLIGEVKWGGAPKTAEANTWTLVHDDSLGPSRDSFAQAWPRKQSYDTMRHLFRCVGAELVSKVYLYSELAEKFFPALEELREHLEFSTNSNRHGAWFTSQEHLHVHFGIKDKDISVGIAQNLCALFGLFEHQIEKWFHRRQRNNYWCKDLREGMKTRKMVLIDPTATGDVDLEYLPERRYTPMGYCEGIYECKTLEELKTWCCGYSRGEVTDNLLKDRNGNISPPDTGCLWRSYTAVHISLARGNKPTTFEFRQHHGTTNAVEIKYWVELCGHLLRFACFLDEAGIQLRDPKRGSLEGSNTPTFLETFVEQDLLEIIGMTEEAKAYFKAQEERFFDQPHDDKRFAEAKLIEERIARVKAGEETGIAMDSKILASESYISHLEIRGLKPLPPIVYTASEITTISGLLDVFDVLKYDVVRIHNEIVNDTVLTLPRPRRGNRLSRKEIADFGIIEETGQIKAWLRYSDWINAEDKRRDANRGSRYWPLATLLSFISARGGSAGYSRGKKRSRDIDC